MQASGLKAVIFGSTGAVGQTLVMELLASNKWQQVLCVVRKQPQNWAKLTNKQKLKIQVEPDLDKLFKLQQWNFQGYDSMFVCFGSQVKHGEQTFKKVDKTYPLLCADIAINNKIPHYLLVSSSGSDPKSSFLYMRTKGQVQAQLKNKNLNLLSILKPGLIKNRPDQRTGQKIAQIFSFLPVFPSIQCLDLATSLRGLAQTEHEIAQKSQKVTKTYENKDLLKFVQEYKKKQFPHKK